MKANSLDNFVAPAETINVLARQLFGSGVKATLETESEDTRVNGTVIKATLCAEEKRCPLILKVVDHGLHEANAFRVLGEGGATIAKLYATFCAADGREVLVLERLERIGIDGSDVDAFGKFVDTLARFNATPAQPLPTKPTGWLRRWLSISHRAWQRADSGAYGVELAQAASKLHDSWSRQEQLAGNIECELAALPVSATHEDPLFGNCGWRNEKELVLFDLSYCTRHPALCDLALCLGACSQRWPEHLGKRPWIECYCESYSRRARHPISVATAERAVALHQAASVMWLDERTFGRCDQNCTDPRTSARDGWGGGLARTWRRLDRMLTDGVEAALIT